MNEENGLRPGLSGRVERVVDETLITRHVGGDGVFGTPFMILLMELAAHDATEPLLEAGTTTVGFEVCVKHLAPTLPGATVVASAVLREVDGRKLLFDVECHEGEKLVGTGTHRRAVVRSR